MNVLKRLSGLLIMFCMAGTLSGCWNNRDINHRALPVTMGVSMEGQVYKVILEIPEPMVKTTRIRLVTGFGRTITEAVDHISRDMESYVDLLHLTVIVFDKAYAEKGVKESISGFMRSRDISPKAIVIICDEDLEGFFNNMKKMMEPSGTTLYNSFEKNAGWDPDIALTRVWQVYRSIHSYTRDVVIPIVKFGKETIIDHQGSAIIKNGRMVGRISTEETLLLNAFNGQGTQGKIEVMNHSSVLIVGDSMKYSSRMVNGRPYMKSRITLKVSILETRNQATDDIIKRELDAMLTSLFRALVDKIQKSEADVLGLGQFFRNKLPSKELKYWRSEYLVRLKMDFSVRTIIRNEGNLKTP